MTQFRTLRRSTVDLHSHADHHQRTGLPRRFAEALAVGRMTEPETFDPITCLFSDIVGYSFISAQV